MWAAPGPQLKEHSNRRTRCIPEKIPEIVKDRPEWLSQETRAKNEIWASRNTPRWCVSSDGVSWEFSKEMTRWWLSPGFISRDVQQIQWSSSDFRWWTAIRDETSAQGWTQDPAPVNTSHTKRSLTIRGHLLAFYQNYIREHLPQNTFVYFRLCCLSVKLCLITVMLYKRRKRLINLSLKNHRWLSIIMIQPVKWLKQKVKHPFYSLGETVLPAVLHLPLFSNSSSSFHTLC